MAKAITLKEVMCWLISKGILHVQLESDCQMLVIVVNASCIDSSSIGLVIQDCKLFSFIVVL